VCEVVFENVRLNWIMLRIREGIGKCDFFGELEIVIENV
jgi:hypothetical protein